MAEIPQSRLLSQWYHRLRGHRERMERCLMLQITAIPVLCTSCRFRDEMVHAAVYGCTLHPNGPDLSRGWETKLAPLASSSWHLRLWSIRPINTALRFSSQLLSPALRTPISLERAAPSLLIPSHTGTKINPNKESVALGREKRTGISPAV